MMQKNELPIISGLWMTYNVQDSGKFRVWERSFNVNAELFFFQALGSSILDQKNIQLFPHAQNDIYLHIVLRIRN